MQISYWRTREIHFSYLSLNPLDFGSSCNSREIRLFLRPILYFQHLLCQDRFIERCFTAVVKLLRDGGRNKGFHTHLEEVGG